MISSIVVRMGFYRFLSFDKRYHSVRSPPAPDEICQRQQVVC